MTLDNKELMTIYEEMLLIRTIEEKVDQLIAYAKITGTTHLGVGHEAIMTGIHHAILTTDYFNITHRMHGLTVLRGDINKFFAELHGRDAGYCRGRGGSTHMIDTEHRNMGANGVIGSAIPVNTGMALALKMKKTKDIFLCSFGDGTLNEGAVHEGFNMAAVWKLPIVYLCENNQYAMSTPVKDAFAIEDFSIRASSYGFPGYRIDGNKVDEVIDTVKKAAQHARSGKGPVLIVAETYRYKGHSKSDMQKYRSKEEVQEWKKKDPVLYVENKLIKAGLLDEKKKTEILTSVQTKVENAVAYAESCPFPEKDSLLDYVYYENFVS